MLRTTAMALLLASCACNVRTPPADTTIPSSTDTDELPGTLVPTLECEHPGCDGLCIPVGSEWSCTDTASPWEVCYLDGYQVCEPQSADTCGWTMLDQAGWDACVESQSTAN